MSVITSLWLLLFYRRITFVFPYFFGTQQPTVNKIYDYASLLRFPRAYIIVLHERNQIAIFYSYACCLLLLCAVVCFTE
jgi:hypothetical protein